MSEDESADIPERSGRDDDKRAGPRSPLRLPVLSGGDERGLGDVVKRATAAVHIRTCGGCEQRAQVLNKWVVFTPRGPRN
jgi:hypothetical protein